MPRAIKGLDTVNVSHRPVRAYQRAALGRGREQKLFCGSIRCQGPAQFIAQALILMGDWCALCAAIL